MAIGSEAVSIPACCACVTAGGEVLVNASGRLVIFRSDGYTACPTGAKSMLYKLAQEGKVPGQKVGKHWRFSKDAIDRWLEHRSVGGEK